MSTRTDFVFQENQSTASVGNAIDNIQNDLCITVGGTFSGTVIVQGLQAGNWFDVGVIDLGSLENKTEITEPGAFAVVAPEAFEAIRCNIVSIESGAITVTGELCEDLGIGVPFIATGSGGGITPTGTKSITKNGTYDITSYASADVLVPASEVVSGSKLIISNGTHDVTNYASANVSVPQPSGTKDITTNGTHDVTNYASANVNVPTSALDYKTIKVNVVGRPYQSGTSGTQVTSYVEFLPTDSTYLSRQAFTSDQNNPITIPVFDKFISGASGRIQGFIIVSAATQPSNNTESFPTLSSTGSSVDFKVVTKLSTGHSVQDVTCTSWMVWFECGLVWSDTRTITITWSVPNS